MFLPDNSVFVPVTDPNMSPERTPSQRLPMEARLSTFQEVEFTYTEEQAENEARRCLQCPTHWCTKKCPAGVPVTEFIGRVQKQDYEGAYQLIRTASMLPEMCSRLCPQERQCQSNCTRSVRTQAVGIGRLERFVVEQHYASGAQEPKAKPTGKRVAVVGSGPAGLAAAQYLADRGHAVTVYERSDHPGGLLEYGIPNMKLEKGVVVRKVDAMKAQGVEFCTGVNVGVDVTAGELTSQYDAVILCVGTGNARPLAVEGAAQVQGVCAAVDYLSASTRALLDADAPLLAALDPRGKDVVIVGGGDTGNDCLGISLRGGCRSVVQLEMLPKDAGKPVVYEPRRQNRLEVKVDSSQEECLSVFGSDPHVYQTTVKSIQTDEVGRLQAVVTVDLEPVYDSQRRLAMKELAGTEKILSCQLLVVAAGFLGPCGYVADAFGLDTDARSNIAASGYATNVAKVYACGDCRTGQSLVVKAMADGRNCAKTVDEALA